jgi:lipoprotein-anchoring transpeptidase ErfK/SrfK
MTELAVAVMLVVTAAACSAKTPGAAGSAGPSGGAEPTAPSAAAAPSTTPPPSGRPVHVRLFQADGSTYGIGMPLIAYLSVAITDAKPFATASKVTVNGTAADGAWYFQKSAIYKDYPVEAHYRLREYWPAHAAIHLDLPLQGLSAGPDLVFDNSLTLDMSTGAANISMVDGRTKRMTVTSDGKQVFKFPVSLGAAKTPTFQGVKVVMDKAKLQRMVGPGYDVKVPWSVRITNSGEFIHSADWNGDNIGRRSTSHGCTNLNVGDAQKYFNFAQVGDVAVYTNTGGGTMPSWDGYGDWNLPWSTWQSGGLVATS